MPNLADIFSFSLFKTPEERRAADIAAFDRKTGDAAAGLELWMEDESDKAEDKAEKKIDKLIEDGVDPIAFINQNPVLPLWQKQYDLKNFTPAEITKGFLSRIEGLQALREMAEDLESQIVIEVKSSPQNYASIAITIDPNAPHEKSRTVLAQAPKTSVNKGINPQRPPI